MGNKLLVMLRRRAQHAVSKHARCYCVQATKPPFYGAAPVSRAWFEAGLGFCLLLLPPMLALVPRGAAPLVAVAGLCAAGLVLADPPGRFEGLRLPAALFGGLLLWGGVSTAWSIDPGRSLILEARLAGLFAAGLALAAAAPRIEAPRRLAAMLLGGTAIAIALTGCDLATAGGLSQYVTDRGFMVPRLNQISVWLTLMLLPVGAFLLARGCRIAALLAAGGMAATVLVLDGTGAKVALALSLPLAALLWAWRRPVAGAAAAVSMLAVLTAPLTLPRLVHLPGIFSAAETYKVSAGHRLLIWEFTGAHIAERPLTGWGLDSSRSIPGGDVDIRPGEKWLPLHPHDSALQVWLELGAPGALMLAALVGWLWLLIARAPWPRLYAAAAGGALNAALTVAVAGWGIWEEWWLGTLELALFAIIAMASAATPPPPARRDGDR